MWGLQQSYAVLKQTGDAVVRESYKEIAKPFKMVNTLIYLDLPLRSHYNQAQRLLSIMPKSIHIFALD